MLAAVLRAPRRLELLTRPTPVARRGEAVVRIAATAVCHTDLEIYMGRHPGVRLPVVMGHEATGVVEAVGDGVARVQPGQAGLPNPVIPRGACGPRARGPGHPRPQARPLRPGGGGSPPRRGLRPARYLPPLP